MAKASRPMISGELPRLSRSHGSATCCAQVPILDSRLTNQEMPKRRVRSRGERFGQGLGRALLARSRNRTRRHRRVTYQSSGIRGTRARRSGPCGERAPVGTQRLRRSRSWEAA